MSLAQHDAPPRHSAPGTAASGQASGYGEQACRQAWDGLRMLSSRFWLGLPTVPQGAHEEVAGTLAMLATAPSPAAYGALALEVQGARDRGIGPASALALVLFGALALERYDGGRLALQLAQVGLDIALRDGGPHAERARAAHAALILPRTGRAGTAAAGAALLALSQGGKLGAIAPLYLAGTGPCAGMSLPLLARHLDNANGAPSDGAQHAAAIELAARASLLHALLVPQPGAAWLERGAAPDPGAEVRFCHWLTRLQAAWYAGELPLACHAAGQARTLLHPFVPAADRVAYHAFSALALARSNDPATLDPLHGHAAALRGMGTLGGDEASASRNLADLVQAARERRLGDALDALSGFETTATRAGTAGLHWVAALAWEEAASLAGQRGLAVAAGQYRQQALASYRSWGALGRIDALRRAWQQDGSAAACEVACSPTCAAPAGVVGELGLSIAHEVNQPLAAITLHAAAAGKWLRRPAPDIERALASLALIGAAGRQAGDIVRNVQRLATCQETEMEDVVVDDAIAQALQLLQWLVQKNGIEIELAPGLAGRTIVANGVQLQQVITNLLVNAIEALADRGAGSEPRRIRIVSRECDAADLGGQVEILVADNGPGIPAAYRERVFGSLFSTKPNNTGMGLSISQAIVRAHGGQIDVEPCQPQGACFRVRLPAEGKPSSPIAQSRYS